MKTIADNIRYYRKRLGLTQKELAEAIGLSEIGIRQIEIGKCEPKCSTIVRLVKVLNITYDEFFNLDMSDESTTGIIETVLYQKGMTIKDLAKLIDVPYTTLIPYFRNIQREFKVTTLKKIADVLEIDFDLLINAEMKKDGENIE